MGRGIRFTTEFKREAVRLVPSSGRSALLQIARKRELQGQNRSKLVFCKSIPRRADMTQALGARPKVTLVGLPQSHNSSKFCDTEGSWYPEPCRETLTPRFPHAGHVARDL